MTGVEFLEKVRSLKNIESIAWDIKGDYFDPDAVWLIIKADGEEIKLPYDKEYIPIKDNPEQDTIRINWMQSVSVCLILNKALEQMGRSERFNVGSTGKSRIENNVSEGISFTIRCIIQNQKELV